MINNKKLKSILLVSSISLLSVFVNINEVKATEKTYQTNQSLSIENDRLNKLISVAQQQIGKPYKWGASGPNSFDCSGFTSYVYKNSLNISLPRTSREQAKVGIHISKNDLLPGDLVFFNTSGKGISHVGIYMGNNNFIHSPSSGKTVSYQNINSNYYSKKYVTARRVVENLNEEENNSLTRAEFTRIINEFYGLKELGSIEFTDVTKDNQYYNDISIAVNKGYLRGKTESEFYPNAYITREEVAVVISRLEMSSDNILDKLNEYTDNQQVSSWAKPAVEYVIEKGYIKGYGNNIFKPKANLTKEQALIILQRMN